MVSRFKLEYPDPPCTDEELLEFRIYIALCVDQEWTHWTYWVQLWLKDYGYEYLPEVTKHWVQLVAYKNDPGRITP